jgi:hypothetical protein
MRRYVLVLLGAALLLVGAVSPVTAAGRPDKSPVELRLVTYEAGFICDFELRWEDLPQHSNVLVFPPDRNGDVVAHIAGQWSVSLTNLDADISKVWGGGGHLKLVFHEDGTIDIWNSGAVVAAYFPGDFGGPSMWFFKGRLHDTAGEEFLVTGHEFRGSVEDICAALAGA